MGEGERGREAKVIGAGGGAGGCEKQKGGGGSRARVDGLIHKGCHPLLLWARLERNGTPAAAAAAVFNATRSTALAFLLWDSLVTAAHSGSSTGSTSESHSSRSSTEPAADNSSMCFPLQAPVDCCGALTAGALLPLPPFLFAGGLGCATNFIRSGTLDVMKPRQRGNRVLVSRRGSRREAAPGTWLGLSCPRLATPMGLR